jgi:hypothetical protein
MIKSIAQECLESDDPISAARGKQAYMGHPQKDILRFHFEDNSCLDFQMSYAPIAAGRTFRDGR